MNMNMNKELRVRGRNVRGCDVECNGRCEGLESRRKVKEGIDAYVVKSMWLNRATLRHDTDTLTSSTPIRSRWRFLSSSPRFAPSFHGPDERVTPSIPNKKFDVILEESNGRDSSSTKRNGLGLAKTLPR